VSIKKYSLKIPFHVAKYQKHLNYFYDYFILNNKILKYILMKIDYFSAHPYQTWE
jgi:hypothetical protein